MLLINVLKDYLVPVRSVLKDQSISILQRHKFDDEGIDGLLNRYEALLVKGNFECFSNHDKALSLAFNLRFPELREFLNCWKANGRELIVKAGFVAIFDEKEAKKTLLESFEAGEFDGQDELGYLLEMLEQLSLVEQDGKTAYKCLLKYNSSGFKGVGSRLNELLDQIVEMGGKIEPYGIGRSRVTYFLSDSSDFKVIASLQLLMILAETGFQVRLHCFNLISSKDWYRVFKAGFEYYPWPFLYYSLQFNDRDLLIRVGQDYVFTEDNDVRNQLDMICVGLFNNLIDSPGRIEESSEIILSSMVKGVNPLVWQDGFMKLWRKLKQNDKAFNDRYGSSHDLLLFEGLLYIENILFLKEILVDCLVQIVDFNSKEGVNKLYYLTNNPRYKSIPTNVEQDEYLCELINKLINGLDDKDLERLFALGYIDKFLNNSQKDFIKNKLFEINFVDISNVRIWKLLLFYSLGVPELEMKVRDGMIQNKFLWNSGIEKDSIHGFGDDFIRIAMLSAPESRTKGINWNEEQLVIIFERLKESLYKITEKLNSENHSIISFTELLNEMVIFLVMFRVELSVVSDYQAILELTKSSRNKSRNYVYLKDGLISNNSKLFRSALSELDYGVYLNDFEIDNIGLVLNRILFQAEPLIDKSLGYIVSWLYYRDRGEAFKCLECLLLRILHKYELEPPEETDKEFIEDRLIRIAWKLKSWNSSDVIIENWLTKGQKSKFNRIRQFIYTVINDHDMDLKI